MAKKSYPAKATGANSPPPQNQQEANQTTATVRHQTFQYSGPLPDPRTMHGYNEILPGSAERILKMAEENAKHFRDIEKLAIDAQIEESRAIHSTMRIGQIFGLLSVGTAFALAGYALALDHATVAGTICSVTVVGLVTVFVTGRNGQK